MAKKTSPLKRNKNLEKLSHDHHHGLVFSVRLKKGNKTTHNILINYVKDFWENHLLTHFEDEERLFLPLLTDTEITGQFTSEHKQIRELVKKVISSANDESSRKYAFQLSELITSHIRFEERKMFPWLEKNSSFAELNNIGNELKENTIKPDNFSPEFWK